MIPRQPYINKIRGLGYTHRGETKRVHIYRKKGATHFILVAKNKLLEEEFVVSSLRQAGLAEEQIKSFITSARS